MKNIIYISLIATILFGCKGNAFLTQKYTRYGHSVAKKSENKKAQVAGSQVIVKNDPKQEPVAEKANNLVSEPTEIQTKTTPSLAGIAHALVNLPKKVSEKVTIGNSESVNDAEPLNLNSKSEIKADQKIEKSKKSNAYKAIVGKILKIIVLVLMLVIILAIIFVLMALSVI